MIGLRSKTPIRNDPRCTTARPPAQEGHRENRHRSATDGSRLWNSPGLPVLPKPSAQTAVWHPEMGTLFRRRSLATVDAESGKTYDLKIGRSGRRVTGRLVLPAGVVWMIRKAEIVPKSSLEKRPIPIGVQVFE